MLVRQGPAAGAARPGQGYSRGMEFDPIDYAKRQIAPMLRLCEDYAAADPAMEAFFRRIADGIDHAQHPDDLAGPLMDLSTAAFRGFDFELGISVVLDETLAAASRLSEALSVDERERH